MRYYSVSKTSTMIEEKVAHMPDALEWAQKKGFDAIKANYEGHEAPKSWLRGEGETRIVPDITGERNGRKSFVEVALKAGKKQMQISKWKLLSLMAAKRGGKLYILAPHGHKAYATSMIRDYNLDAELASI